MPIRHATSPWDATSVPMLPRSLRAMSIWDAIASPRSFVKSGLVCHAVAVRRADCDAVFLEFDINRNSKMNGRRGVETACSFVALPARASLR